MKGYSLTTATMRKMIEDVHDKCKENNTDILCEVSDGQWIKNINHAIERKPLTRLQFQKKIWNNVLSMRKKNLIQYVKNLSMVREDTLLRWSEATEILMVDGTHYIGNITVTSETNADGHGNAQHKLSVQFNRGTISNEPLMCKVATPPAQGNSRLWK